MEKGISLIGRSSFIDWGQVEAYPGHPQTPKVEKFAIATNGFQSLFSVTNLSILYIWLGSGYVSGRVYTDKALTFLVRKRLYTGKINFFFREYLLRWL